MTINRTLAHFSVKREFKARPDEVWNQVGHFDTLSWHPGIESGTVEGDTRTLVSRGGGPVFQEKLLETAPHSLRYQMVEGLPAQPVATFHVDSNGHGGSLLSWEAELDTTNLAPALAQGLESGISAFYAAGLDNLGQAFPALR